MPEKFCLQFSMEEQVVPRRHITGFSTADRRQLRYKTSPKRLIALKTTGRKNVNSCVLHGWSRTFKNAIRARREILYERCI